MDVYALCEKVGGEIVRGRVRYRDESNKWVELGRLNGDTMELSKEGLALVREYESDTPKRRRRGSKLEPSSSEASGLAAGLE